MPSNNPLDSDELDDDILPSILNGSPFKIRSNQEKLAILKIGRPVPELNIVKRDVVKGCNRTFQTSWYDVHKWLCGSKSYNKLFCWPCILMRPESSSWCSTGNDDLKRLTSVASKHAGCKSHLKAIAEYDAMLAKFGQPAEFGEDAKVKEEDGLSEADSLDSNFDSLTCTKVDEKRSVEVEGQCEKKTSNPKPSSKDCVRAKITFKTWQDLNRGLAAVSSPSRKFFEDQKLYKWKRRVARQELKNARLAGEKLKLEIEVLRAKAEYYKSLNVESSDTMSSIPSALHASPNCSQDNSLPII